MPTSAQGIATITCGLVLGLILFVGVKRQGEFEPPPELKVSTRPKSATVKTNAVKTNAAKSDAFQIEAVKRKPEPRIRVNLTAKPLAKLRIGVRGPFVIRSLENQRVLWEGERLSESELTLGPQGFQIGSKTFSRQPLEIAPKTSALVVVNGHAYLGVARIYPQKSGKLSAVNVLPIEDYISCVIDAEMPAKFPQAAREAQAIVARTYALWQMEQAEPVANYDVFATVRSQKYLGVEYPGSKGRRLAGESASSREAAAATRGQVCQWNGRLFCTYYSAVCGGATTPGREVFTDAAEPLKSVPCTWCRDSDKYRWDATLTADELLKAIPKPADGKSLAAIKTIRQTAAPKAGVISQFEIGDGRKTVSVSGTTIRQNLPAGKLLSPHFSLTLANTTVTVKGQGFGHGAGLCQWGTRGLANSGKSGTEIVQYYYPGSTVVPQGY